MALLKDVRSGLKTRLETVSGLVPYDRIPKTIQPPCAIVWPTGARYEWVMGSSLKARYQFNILILVQDTESNSAQTRLDDYLSPSGSSSIVAGLLGDDTLGGVSEFVDVDGFTDYAPHIINDMTYLGATIQMSVVA